MAKQLFRKRNIGLFMKVVIAFVALWFIYHEVQIKNQDTSLRFGMGFLLEPAQTWLLVSLLVCMLLNWFLEAWKWRLLIQPIEKVSAWLALKAIFSGITISIFTPNRVGEYGGRIFHLKTSDRIDATLLTIVGSYAQLVVTITSGIMASYFFIPRFLSTGPITDFQYQLIGIPVFGLCILLVVLFLNTRLLTTLLNWLPIPQKFVRYTQVFQYHQSATLWKVFLASLARYVIFTFQFYILLHIFDVAISYPQAMMMISMTYFVMTAIPTFAITELGVRGSVSVYFIGMLSSHTAGIFSASAMLWLINLAIPALLGVIFIFQLRFFRKSD